MSSAAEKAMLDGHYARKQLRCRDAIIAWSHASRFKLARALVENYAGPRLLDYGCGDGTFLAQVRDLFPQAVGADEAGQVGDCRRRFASLSGLAFETVEQLRDPAYNGAFGVVTCMEVLEHCVPSAGEFVLSDLRRMVAGTGTVIVSVPIEIGPTLIGKQIVRALATWRGLGDYKYREKYRLSEFSKMIFAGPNTRIARPLYSTDSDNRAERYFHGHKGFNWRALRPRLGTRFHMQSMHFSPLPRLGGYLSSQVWFVCTPK